MKREWWVLAFIFILVFGVRLYFAFQSEYFSYDSYSELRKVEYIKEHGLPLLNDELSYGGRTLLYTPGFHYILAFFSLFMPVTLVGKILPNLFIASLVVVIYLIIKKITKNKEAGLIGAFTAGFIPLLFARTANQVSVYSLSIPIVFFLLYLFIDIKRKNIKYFIILIFILSLIHPSAFLLIMGLLIYFFLSKIEHLNITKTEVELILFSTFLIFWVEFLIFKNAFLFHGFGLIWQNIPKQIINLYFKEIGLLKAIYLIGIIPLIGGLISIYKTISKSKNKNIFLFVSFGIGVFVLSWFKLIKAEIGIIFLGIILVITFGQFYATFSDYLKKTRFNKLSISVMVLVIVLLALTSVLPSLVYANISANNVPSRGEFDALQWVKENTQEESVVLSTLKEGSLVMFVAERRNVVDMDFLLIKNAEQRIDDIKTIYTTLYKTDAVGLLEKYEVDYVYFSEEAKKEFGIEKLNFIDERCFNLVYNKSIEIYESLCRMEEYG